MKELRSNLKAGARLVLAVLAVSFASSLAQAAPASLAAQKRQSIARQERGGCAVCIAKVLAEKVIFATPPLLRLHEAFELLYATTDAEFIHLKSAGAILNPPRAS